jgi:hypothetical protein
MGLCQLELRADFRCKSRSVQRRAQQIELHLLRISNRSHQQQVFTQRVTRAQRTQPRRPLSEDTGVGQPHTGNRSLGEGLNLGGI